jgi:hypothetical protein
LRSKRDGAVEKNLRRYKAFRDGNMAEENPNSRLEYMFSSIRFIVIWNLFIDINFFTLVYNLAVREET